MNFRAFPQIAWNPRVLWNPRTPGGSDIYDPRSEQLRAQRQAIYETQILSALGKPRGTPFRDPRTGRRADTKLPMERIGQAVSRFMFAMGTAVQQRDDRLRPGSQRPTEKTVHESAARALDPNHLVRNRQDYEETIAMARKSGFYRVTLEPVSWTDDGFAWFVWPMPPGAKLPQAYSTEQEAQTVARRLSATSDPRRTNTWWKPPKVAYSARELAFWLPPAEVLQPAYDLERRAELRRLAKARGAPKRKRRSA